MYTAIERNGKITAYKTCTLTGELYQVTVDSGLYFLWLGKSLLIQEAFPELCADDREFLISGTTPAEWLALYGCSEDDEEERPWNTSRVGKLLWNMGKGKVNK